MVYLWLSQVFLFLYQALFAIFDLANKKILILKFFAAFLLVASLILYYNTKYYPCFMLKALSPNSSIFGFRKI